MALKDGLRRSADWRHPPHQEKVLAAQRAAIGPQDPMDRPLHGVPHAYAPEINRSAMRTARRKHFLASFLTVGFSRAACTLHVAPECGRRVLDIVVVGATAPVGAAGVAGSFDLFWRPQIRLRQFHMLFRARNLALVSLC